MDWATQRRFIYIGALILIILVVFALPIYRSLTRTPTCFDGKQNGSERGIDCGGSCSRVCPLDIEEPVVLWSRSFEVNNGVYSAVAMIENSNSGLEALNIPYLFKLFDKDNILVYERKGRTNIFSGRIFPVFEGVIVVGERVPIRTFFEFSPEIDWTKITREKPEVSVKNKILKNEESTPRIEAELENRFLGNLRDVEIVVVVYNSQGNAIGGSKTVVDLLEKDSSKDLVFTWPKPFPGEVNRIDIIPKTR